MKALIRDKYNLIKNKTQPEKVKLLTKEIKFRVKAEKVVFYAKKFNKAWGNSKEQWKIIRQLTKGDNAKIPISVLEVDGRTITDSNEIADTLNKYFVEAATQISDTLPPIPPAHPLLSTFHSPRSNNSMFLKPTDPKEIQKQIMKLKNGKSPGLDGLKAEHLKSVATVISPVLAHLVNLSFQSGIFPTSLKAATVVPLFKKGDPKKPQSYRPISLLKSISKVWEKLMCTRLTRFLDKNKWFSRNQFGFRPNMGTEDALLEFSSYVFSTVNSGRKCGAIMIDIARAFECCIHRIFLEILERAGVRGPALAWFASYLSIRTQRVLGSTSRTLSCGTVQGGCLSPLLFIIYINELCGLKFHGKLIAYADDTVLVYNCATREEMTRQMTEDLYKLRLWFNF